MEDNLSLKQKEVLIGTLLGDAYMVKGKGEGRRNSTLGFCHGKHQIEYLQYKHEIFKNIFKSGYRKKQDYKFYTTEFGGNVANITSNATVDLNQFRELKNKDDINIEKLEKYFTEISLAFWIMDDGSLSYPRGKTFKGTKYLMLHTEGFKKIAVQKLIELLDLQLQ